MESIILDGAKWILGCLSKTSNEAVSCYMSLDTLQSCLIRSGILSHVEEGRGKCEVGWRILSVEIGHQILFLACVEECFVKKIVGGLKDLMLYI